MGIGWVAAAAAPSIAYAIVPGLEVSSDVQRMMAKRKVSNLAEGSRSREVAKEREWTKRSGSVAAGAAVMAFANAALFELSREPQRRIANKKKKILNDGKHRRVAKVYDDRSKLREERRSIISWYLRLCGSLGDHGRSAEGDSTR